MNNSIVPLSSLTALPSADLAAFGVKTAGVVELMNAAPSSPVQYLVPDGWAIPAGASGTLDEAGIRRAFDDLTGKMASSGALLIRSSALDEEPGQNLTRFVAWRREQAEKSFAQFCAAIHEVGESKGPMGVLLMPLVGGLSVLTDGREAHGWKNVSFSADSHSPFDPGDVFISMVHGVGTRAVEAGSEYVSITAERNTGRITSIANREESYILHSGYGQSSVENPDHYRQRSADFFSVEDGMIKSAMLCLGDAEYQDTFKDSSRWSLEDGRFQWKGEFAKVELPPNLKKSRDPERRNMQAVGFLPIQSAQAALNLIGILHYLSQRSGTPVEIEGAFPDSSSEVPVLYQKIDMPLPAASRIKVPMLGADVVSSSVIGSCDIQGPLLYLFCRMCVVDFESENPNKEVAAAIAALEEKGVPYTLVAVDHNAALIKKTPNCRVRISRYSNENVASHPVAYTRLKQSREPSAGYVLALGATTKLRSLRKQFNAYYDRRIKKRMPDYLIFDNARVRANGKKLAVWLEPKRIWPLRNLIRRFFWRRKG